jgi:hypothetical protein
VAGAASVPPRQALAARGVASLAELIFEGPFATAPRCGGEAPFASPHQRSPSRAPAPLRSPVCACVERRGDGPPGPQLDNLLAR